MAQWQRIHLPTKELWVRSLGQEDSPWSRKWKPTLIFLSGKTHGQRSLVGYSPWGHKWEGYDLAIPCVHAKLLQSCPTLCNSRDCSPPGSSVHGILQARILEWIAGPSSRASSWPRDWTCVSYIYLHRQVGSLSLALPGKPDLATKQHQTASGFAGPKYFIYLFIFKRYIFLYRPFLKSLLNWLQYCFYFYVLAFWLPGMRDLSSLLRDRTHTSCIGRWSLDHWTAREVPSRPFKQNSQSVSHSVVSDSLLPHGFQPARPSVHGILQARILDWVAMPSSEESSQPRDRTQVSCLAGTFFTTWATKEAKIVIGGESNHSACSCLCIKTRDKAIWSPDLSQTAGGQAGLSLYFICGGRKAPSS